MGRFSKQPFPQTPSNPEFLFFTDSFASAQRLRLLQEPQRWPAALWAQPRDHSFRQLLEAWEPAMISTFSSSSSAQALVTMLRKFSSANSAINSRISSAIGLVRPKLTTSSPALNSSEASLARDPSSSSSFASQQLNDFPSNQALLRLLHLGLEIKKARLLAGFFTRDTSATSDRLGH